MVRKCCKRCNQCEMLIEDESIVVIKQQGLSETRRVIPAVKCMKFGQYSTTLVSLPESKILDDTIYER